jgi:SAM-dependent methyltransferase
LLETFKVGGEVKSGQLVCRGCAQQYPIIRFVPRFAPPENYANSFGLQWNRFRQTQLDSYSGLPISRERFFRTTGWKPEEMKDKWVFDVGCGAGRFTEIALSTGGNVIALDYSSAVDACWENLSKHSNLDVVQGDIYHLPFKPESFDFIYCLGVLQHTPNVQKAFMALFEHLRNGGKLVVDVYPRLFLNILWSKYWLRPLTKRMSQKSLYRMVEAMIKYLLPISLFIGRISVFGLKLRYVIPVANYEGIYPLSKDQLQEWAILDTFDMLAPTYDHPISLATLNGWFLRSGFKNIQVFRRGLLIGKGIKNS